MKLTKTIAAIILGCSMTSAYALSERGQGVLQGLVGAWVIGRVIESANQPQPEYYAPPPVYVYPAPPPPPPPVYYYRPTCYQTPYYDHWGRIAYYRQVCR
jgi:hypothetical protein